MASDVRIALKVLEVTGLLLPLLLVAIRFAATRRDLLGFESTNRSVLALTMILALVIGVTGMVTAAWLYDVVSPLFLQIAIQLLTIGYALVTLLIIHSATGLYAALETEDERLQDQHPNDLVAPVPVEDDDT